MKKLLAKAGKAMLPLILEWAFKAFLRTLDTEEERVKIARTMVGKFDIPNLTEEEEVKFIADLLGVLYNDLLSQL